jgi:hypothetical protein
LHYLLFIFYLVLFCWLLPRITFIKNAGLNTRILIGLFLLRVVFGMVSVYIDLYYYPWQTDVAGFYLQGTKEYHLLWQNPVEYLTNIFQSKYSDPYGSFFGTHHSYWNNLRNNLIIKLMSVLDIFSGVNIYVNSLLYNFLVFWGSIGLYRVFIKIFPGRRTILLLTVFLLPSSVYFSSSIHRDGLIFLSLSMITFYVYSLMAEKKYYVKRIIYLAFFSLLIILLRNFVFLALIPALISWIISRKVPRYAFLIFLVVYGVFIILFFATSYLPPAYDLPAHVSSRQIEFIAIAKRSASILNMDLLFPHTRSFFNNIPQALNHSFMRPYLTEHNNFLVLLAGLEIVVYEILTLLYLFFRKSNFQTDPIIFYMVFFAISIFLMIGYTIPILGAIARYRSIYFPFILTPLLCYTDWARLKNILSFK